MKYKKVVIFFILISGAAAFFKAAIRPEDLETVSVVKQEVLAASDKGKAKESEKIAVVNLDEGVPGESGQINYAEKLSRFPSLDFEYSSLEAARTGLETGKYGAYVIIPAAFSRNVESINKVPQTSRLEYAVNQSYSGERQYELLYNVLGYVDSLNNRLSYMYVDNILKEFHEAQDGADKVMDNDLIDKNAIETIQAQDLITLTEAPQMQPEENETEILDLSGYLAENTKLTESLREEYEKDVKNILTEISSLQAAGEALCENLNRLSGQVPEIYLTVDVNGENIAEKADIQLREELMRQSEHMPEKENMIRYLRKFKENNEELMREWEQPGESLYDADGRTASGPEDRSKTLLSLLEEENQEIDTLLEELEQTEDLDIERISELVRKEYTEPIELKAEELKNTLALRYSEELTAVTEYNGQLAGFQPQMDSRFILQSIHGLSENYGAAQNALLENNQAYMEYAQKSITFATDYADELQRYAAQMKMDSAAAVTEGLKEAQNIKEKTSLENQKILADFVSKLPYTRIGSAEYTQVYQFVVSPLLASDESKSYQADSSSDQTKERLKAQVTGESLDPAVTGDTAEKRSIPSAVYAGAGILSAACIAGIYFCIRRKKDYEY